MAKLKYEVVAITGKYTDAQGAEKKRYTKIGVILQNDKGFSLKLEAVPVGWDGWAMLSEPKQKDAPKKDARDVSDIKDDIPWQ